MLLLAAVAACGPSRAAMHYRRTTEAADDAARRWASSLPACPIDVPDGALRFEGTITISSGGRMTELLCESPECCNTLWPDAVELAVSDGSSARLDVADAPGGPEVLLRVHEGGTLSCAWPSWTATFRSTPVVVIGTEAHPLPDAQRWIRAISICAP